MPTYVFKGRNRMNEIVTGERLANNREALRQILRREQVTLTSVKEKGREIGIPKLSGRKKVKSKDLAIFTRAATSRAAVRRGTSERSPSSATRSVSPSRAIVFVSWAFSATIPSPTSRK